MTPGGFRLASSYLCCWRRVQPVVQCRLRRSFATCLSGKAIIPHIVEVSTKFLTNVELNSQAWRSDY